MGLGNVLAGAIGGAGIPYLSGAVAGAAQARADDKQMKLQRDQFDFQKDQDRFQRDQVAYQKDLQQTIFNREDTAAQRKAADLQAAGLSKTLAAGQPSAAGQAVGLNSPSPVGASVASRKFDSSSDMEALFGLLTMDNNIAKNDQELINMKKQGDLIDAQKRKVNAESVIDEYEYSRAHPISASVRHPNQYVELAKIITHFLANDKKEFYDKMKAPKIQPKTKTKTDPDTGKKTHTYTGPPL